MSGFSIRPARAEDAAPLQEVVRQAYAPWMERLEGLPDVADGLANDIAEAVVEVAVLPSGQIVGGIVLRLSADGAHIANLAVSPDCAGQGIGQALLKRAEQIALGAGHTRLALATHKDMTPTLRFYERQGWEISGGAGLRLFLRKSLT